MQISTFPSTFLKRVTGPKLNYELETILSSINTLLFYKNKLMGRCHLDLHSHVVGERVQLWASGSSWALRWFPLLTPLCFLIIIKRIPTPFFFFFFFQHLLLLHVKPFILLVESPRCPGETSCSFIYLWFMHGNCSWSPPSDWCWKARKEKTKRILEVGCNTGFVLNFPCLEMLRRSLTP